MCFIRVLLRACFFKKQVRAHIIRKHTTFDIAALVSPISPISLVFYFLVGGQPIRRRDMQEREMEERERKEREMKEREMKGRENGQNEKWKNEK